MAVSVQLTAELIGYIKETYTKKDTGEVKETYTYYALVRQRVDKATGLPTECQLFELREDTQVLGEKLKAGAKVTFWQSERSYWNASQKRVETIKVYEGIEAV